MLPLDKYPSNLDDLYRKWLGQQKSLNELLKNIDDQTNLSVWDHNGRLRLATIGILSAAVNNTEWRKNNEDNFKLLISKVIKIYQLEENPQMLKKIDHIFQNLKNIFRSETTDNVDVNGINVEANSLLLGSHSPFFDTLLNSGRWSPSLNSKESDVETVKIFIKGIEDWDFQQFDQQLSLEDWRKLLKLSQNFGTSRTVSRFIENILKDKITGANAQDIFLISREFKLSNLIKEVDKFIFKNINAKNLYTFISAIQDWVNEEPFESPHVLDMVEFGINLIIKYHWYSSQNVEALDGFLKTHAPRISGIYSEGLSRLTPELRSQVLDLLPKNIKILNLSHLKDLSVLERFQDLRHLTLHKCLHLENLDTLHGNQKLSSLDLSGCSQLKSLRGATNFTDLTYLNIKGCHEITNEELRVIGGHPNIKNLSIECDNKQKLTIAKLNQ